MITMRPGLPWATAAVPGLGHVKRADEIDVQQVPQVGAGQVRYRLDLGNSSVRDHQRRQAQIVSTSRTQRSTASASYDVDQVEAAAAAELLMASHRALRGPCRCGRTGQYRPRSLPIRGAARAISPRPPLMMAT